MREVLQQKAVDSFSGNAILACCPRFGKIATSIKIFKRDGRRKVLIAYPTLDIKQSWLDDFKKWEWDGSQVTFTAFNSLKKYVDEVYDIVVCDEIHDLSNAELETLKKIGKHNEILGLSGSMTKKTKSRIWEALRISPCFTYSIDEGVRDGILADYEIIVERIPLDDKTLLSNGKTEQKQFKALKWVYDKLEKGGESTFFMDLKIQSLLQNSVSKIERTKELIKEYEADRLLVFCGNTTITDQLGIPVYHSKKKEEQLFKDFCNGVGNHLAVCKLGGMGVTIKPINLGILNYTSGNPEDCCQRISRFLGAEWDNPSKKAKIIVLCSDCQYQIDRITTALMMFDSSKIVWK